MGQEAAKNRRGHGQQYGQRNRPAFVQSCQAQEDENHRNDVNLSGTAAGLDFIAALVNPFIGVGAGQSFLCYLFQCCHCLTSGIAISRVTGNHNGARTIEARHNQGAVLLNGSYQGVQRHHVAIIAAHEEITQIVHGGTILGIGLHNYLPGTTEVVDIVDFVTAQEGLHCGINAGYGHAHALRLFAVHIKIIHRSIGVQSGINHANLRTLASLSQELVRTLAHHFHFLATEVHQIQAQSTGIGGTGQGRRLEGHNIGIRILSTQAKDHRNNLLGSSGTIVVIVHNNYHQSRVSLLRVGKNIHAGNGHNVLNTGELAGFGSDIFNNLQRTVAGRSLGQVYGYGAHALVLVRHKAGRGMLSDNAGQNNHNGQTGEHQLGFADADLNIGDIFAQSSFEPIVEGSNCLANEALGSLILALLLQNQGAERRSQRQSYNCTQHHGYGYSNSELLVQFTNSTAGEGNGDKYCGQNEGDSHNRAGYLVHRAIGCFLRGHAIFLNMMLNSLNYNDSVVDNEADGQNHRKSGQRVNGKAQKHEGGKGANQGYGHGQQRNQGCAPAA